MKKTSILLLMAVVLFAATSCKKDKENPAIVVSTPIEHSHYTWGSEVHIMASFSDDRGLKNYTVSVGDMEGNLNTTINFNKSENIEGLTADFHDHFMVPTNAPEMAYIHFNVTDQEGKVSNTKWMIHFNE